MKSFVKSLIIIIVLTKCLLVFQSESYLSNTLLPSDEQLSSVLKFANIQQENLRNAIRSSKVADNDEDKRKGENEKKSIMKKVVYYFYVKLTCTVSSLT